MAEEVSELIKESYPCSIFYADLDPERHLKDNVTKQWTDNPQGVSPEYPYEFVCTRFYREDPNRPGYKRWDDWSIQNISLWAHYGMNATPYQVILGNSYESIYAIEASGAKKEAYVILDGGGVTTGEILFQGGEQNKNKNYNLKIDKLSILDSTGNTAYSFDNSNYLTVDLGEGWNCRFEIVTKNGNPVINLIGIGPNPDQELKQFAPSEIPDTIEVDSNDLIYKCNLGGKYQKKIIIEAYNEEKNIKSLATWTITAIRDKNGDGIWRYRIMPNIDRVVYSAYYKRLSSSDQDVTQISGAWNIGSAVPLKFDVEKDTYGKAWQDLTSQEFKLVITNEFGEEVLTSRSFMNSPATFDIEDIKDIMRGIAQENVLYPALKQYQVELQVEDSDYGEGFSTVDKCNLLFEYVVNQAGKDGKDGNDGSSAMFNLTNDSGSFTYDYVNKQVVINTRDCSTDIQYAAASDLECCEVIEIGNRKFSDSGSGVFGEFTYNLEKKETWWTLTVTSITMQGDEFITTYALPVTGYVKDKVVGTATFKMTGVKDLNGDGAYAYRVVVEHPYTTIDASTQDTLDVTLYRDILMEGKGVSDSIPMAIRVTSKDTGESLGIVEVQGLSCSQPQNADTKVTMATIQANKGAVVELYTKDADYDQRVSLDVNGQTYYFTGETEDISYTASAASLTDDQLNSLLEKVDIYNYTGQAARTREWKQGDYYFPVISQFATLSLLQGEFEQIASSATEDLVTTKIKGSDYICPRFYDIVYYGTDEQGDPAMWIAKRYSQGKDSTKPGTGDYWEQAESFDFIKANAAYIKQLSAQNVQAEKILVKDSDNKYVAGMINGESAYEDIKKTNNTSSSESDNIVIFAGLPSDANSLKDASFTVDKEGIVQASKFVIKKSEAIPEPIPGTAWFEFIFVESNGEQIYSPVLHWYDGKKTRFLDMSSIIQTIENGGTVVDPYYVLVPDTQGYITSNTLYKHSDGTIRYGTRSDSKIVNDLLNYEVQSIGESPMHEGDITVTNYICRDHKEVGSRGAFSVSFIPLTVLAEYKIVNGINNPTGNYFCVDPYEKTFLKLRTSSFNQDYAGSPYAICIDSATYKNISEAAFINEDYKHYIYHFTDQYENSYPSFTAYEACSIESAACVQDISRLTGVYNLELLAGVSELIA